MDIFKNRKGVFCAHPFMLFVVGFILGALLIYLIAKGTISLGFTVC